MTSWLGVALDATAIVFKYTYEGDANLDGQVDISDLSILSTAWQQNGTWFDGDVDYSGFIDITALSKLATNWQVGVGAPLLVYGDPSAGFWNGISDINLTQEERSILEQIIGGGGDDEM